MSAPQTVCSHLSWVRQPAKGQAIYKEECTQCFQDDTSEGGVDVCLHCFNGGCTGADSMQHSAHHAKLCHPVVLNMRKREIVRESSSDVDMVSDAAASEKMSAADLLQAHKKKLEDEADQPTHFYETVVRCIECNVTLDTAQHEALTQCVQAVLESQAPSQQAKIGFTEEEIKSDCPHCDSLTQVADPPQLGDRSLTSCGSCEVKDAMWLCLTCGVLGCSRRQMISMGEWSVGNAHAASHAQSTGHPVVVKIGTITPEGRGECYCYQCDTTVENKNLSSHLRTFNIDLDSTNPTERTTAEMSLELNLKMNWSLVFEEDGKEAELAFGPGRTGLANLGNSCYMASVLQVLFGMPHFHQRYFTTALQHLSLCQSVRPHDCFQCQMSKLAIGLLSGRYDPQPSEAVIAEITKERLEREARNLAVKEGRATQAEIEEAKDVAAKSQRKPLQYGVPPRMFKTLVAGKHAEFSSGRQQDSFEYIHFLLDYIKQKEHQAKFDPYEPFYFHQEDRLECTRCNRVRYTNVKTTEVSLPIPLPEPLPAKEAPPLKEGEKAKKVPKEYPPVSFQSCITEWTQPQVSADWQCPHCKQVSSARKSSRMTTFPSVLMVHMRRFVYEGWVPEKLDIGLEFNAEQPTRITLEEMRARGLQPGEVELPTDVTAAAAAPAQKTPDAAIVASLESMGFGTFACQRAALAVDNASADIAASWLFAHMDDADLNDPLPAASAPSSSGGSASEPSDAEIDNLTSMGFDPIRCRHALKQCGNDASRAVEWLFSHMDEDIPMESDSAASGSSQPQVVQPDVGPANYELFAFVTHIGKSTGSGHYIAHVQKDGKWLQFNDHKVSYVANPMRAASAAYVYFFRRV